MSDSGTPDDSMAWIHPLQAVSSIPGHEVGVRVVRRGPGVQGKRHSHPGGHEWFTVISGSLVFTNGTQPDKLLTTGQGDYIPPDVIHCGRNPSATETVVLQLFYLKPIGQPVLIYA